MVGVYVHDEIVRNKLLAASHYLCHFPISFTRFSSLFPDIVHSTDITCTGDWASAFGHGFCLSLCTSASLRVSSVSVVRSDHSSICVSWRPVPAVSGYRIVIQALRGGSSQINHHITFYLLFMLYKQIIYFCMFVFQKSRLKRRWWMLPAVVTVSLSCSLKPCTASVFIHVWEP